MFLYRDYIDKKIQNGIAKSPEELLHSAFTNEIKALIESELESCMALPLGELVKSGCNRLFTTRKKLAGTTGGSTGGKIASKSATIKARDEDIKVMDLLESKKGTVLPSNLTLNVGHKLQLQYPQTFKYFKSKLFLIFGPTREQYMNILRIINTAVAKKKVELKYRYINNFNKLREEFIKLDICATHVKESLFQYIDAYPNYESVCHLTQDYKIDFTIDYIKELLDLIEQGVSHEYNYAKSIKELLKKSMNNIKELYARFQKEYSMCTNVPTKKKILDDVRFSATAFYDSLAKRLNTPMLSVYGDRVKGNNPLERIDSSISALIEGVSGSQGAYRNMIADSKDLIVDTIHYIKHIFRTMYENVLDKLKYNHVQYSKLDQKIKLLDAVIDAKSAGSRLSTQEKNRLSTIDKRFKSLQKYQDIFSKPLDAQVNALNTYTKDLFDIFSKVGLDSRTNQVALYNKRIRDYCNLIKHSKIVYEYVYTWFIIVRCINGGEYETIAKGTLSGYENILKYVFSNQILSLQETISLGNKLLSYTAHVDELKSNFDPIFRHYNQWGDVEIYMREHKNQFVNDAKDLYCATLLNKNINKILDLSKETPTLIRLQQYVLTLKNKKINNLMMLTNSVHKNKMRLMVRKNQFHKIMQYVKNLGGLINKGFMFIINKLFEIQSNLDASKYAMLVILSESFNKIDDNQIFKIYSGAFDASINNFINNTYDIFDMQTFISKVAQNSNSLNDMLVEIISNKCSNENVSFSIADVKSGIQDIINKYDLKTKNYDSFVSDILAWHLLYNDE